MRPHLAALLTTLLPAFIGQRWIDGPVLVRWCLGSVLGIVFLAFGGLVGGLVGAIVPGAVVALGAAWILGPRYRWRPASLRLETTDRRALALVFGVGACLLVLAAMRPVAGWDGWFVWSLKAKSLALAGSFNTPVFVNPVYTYSNPDYPTLLPSWQALAYLLSGNVTVSWPLQFQQAWLWTMSAASLILLTAAVRPARFLLLLAWAISPQVLWQSMQGYADVPMSLFLIVGTIVLWTGADDFRGRTVGVILLAGAALTKDEGLLFALIVVGSVMIGRRPRRLLATAPIVIAAWLPWFLFIKMHRLSNYVANSSTLLSFLGKVTGRTPPILKSMTIELLSPVRWGLLVPACLLLVVLHRAVVPRLGIAVLLGLSAVVVIYVLTPFDLAAHLATSLNRVLIAPVGLVAVAATFRNPEVSLKELVSGGVGEQGS